ncbi:MAG: hypothetical protein ACFBSE_00565 [Prochloraceae cyanobacterium]
MIEERLDGVNFPAKDKLDKEYRVKVKLNFKKNFRYKIIFVRYRYSLRAIETLETIQLWLGMKFGFNILGILLN